MNINQISLSSSDEKLLASAIENGILNLDDVQDQMNKVQRKRVLAEHPYSIWQMKDGRWRTYIKDDTRKSGRRTITKTKKRDLEDVIINHELGYSDDNSKLTLRKLYPEWLKFKSAHTDAQPTIDRINTEWKKHYINDPIVDKPIDQIKKTDLDLWLHSKIKDNHMTKKQYYNFSLIIRQALEYAYDAEYIDKNPMARIKINTKLFRKVKKPDSKSQVFSPKEYEKLKQMAWNDFYTETKEYVLSPLALIFMFQTAVRIGEVCAVRYEDLNERKGFIHIQRMYRKSTGEVVPHPKTDAGDRFVYLTDEAKHIIHEAKKWQFAHGVYDGGYIFSAIPGKSLHHYPIEDLFRKYCTAIGTTQKSSYKARKTAISAMIDGDVNIDTIREMVGHEDERTTYASYVFDRAPEKEKMAKIERAIRTI